MNNNPQMEDENHPVVAPSENAERDFLDEVFKELGEQQHNHRHCVILMHGFLELLVNTLIEAKCRNAAKIVSDTRTYPHSVKLVLLHELGIISDSQFRMYDWFRRLRNRAAHAALFKVTQQDLQRFQQTRFQESNQFALLCVDIFADLWNSHVSLFAPKFSPSAHKQPQLPTAPDYLEYSRNIFVNHHVIAQVKAQLEKNRIVEYRYDHYPDLERIVTGDGKGYVRAKWEAWKESEDWGETGQAITSELARELDAVAEYVRVSFFSAMPRDHTQGGTVWKLVNSSKEEAGEVLTYERTREKPKTGGVYPRYTFVRHTVDKETSLLLKQFTGQVRSDKDLTPIAIRYDYLFLTPSATFVVRDEKNEGT